jgi:hypothetical protein
MNEQRTKTPLIDKEKTRKTNGPICPYCLSPIERLSTKPESSQYGCSDFRYMYFQECHALLGLLPMTAGGGMDEEETMRIIKG